MFFSSPDVFSPSTTVGRAFCPSGLPRGEISGEAGWPGRGAGLLLRKDPLGEDVSWSYPNFGKYTTSVPDPQAKSFAAGGPLRGITAAPQRAPCPAGCVAASPPRG